MLTIGQQVFCDGEEATVVAHDPVDGVYSLEFPDGQVVEGIWIGEIDTEGQPQLPLA